MEAKCLAITHAELGSIAVQRAAQCRPQLVENRTMTSNMMSSPPADRAHLACQEKSGACATVLCGMPARKECDGGQAGADRGEMGGKDCQSTIGDPLLICHSSRHFLF